jgi:hypothetical protein
VKYVVKQIAKENLEEKKHKKVYYGETRKFENTAS